MGPDLVADGGAGFGEGGPGVGAGAVDGAFEDSGRGVKVVGVAVEGGEVDIKAIEPGIGAESHNDIARDQLLPVTGDHMGPMRGVVRWRFYILIRTQTRR
ncbi:hypothetical protein [Glycomyces tenuis]|uniref:hypothetical protein n=1 Tax=Glycomyces tenuis TaxID=58116 RepID=UPI0004213AA8|nr:hypothetical protein [Glycomyces tenuis]